LRIGVLGIVALSFAFVCTVFKHRPVLILEEDVVSYVVGQDSARLSTN
jgi:hypothetical protein